MLTHDLIAVLAYLGIDSLELAALIGEDEARCDGWMCGKEPVPVWLDQLTYCWAEYPDTLAIARENVTVRLDEALAANLLAVNTVALAQVQ